jgi:hypothetical protein
LYEVTKFGDLDSAPHDRIIMIPLTTSQFKALYEAYVREHGDHFETGRLPMTPEEAKLFERNRRLTRRVLVPMLGATALMAAAGSAYSLINGSWVPGVGMLLGTIAAAGMAIGYWFGAAPGKGAPEKFYMKGIITDKRRSGSWFTRVSYYVELSEEKTVYLWKDLYASCRHGDIVRCDRLTEDSVYADSLVKLGSIREGEG